MSYYIHTVCNYDIPIQKFITSCLSKYSATVADALTAKGYKLLSAQVEMLPQNGYIKLTNEDDIKNMQKMLDMFEDNDDVQNVWHNWEDAE